MCCSSSSSSTSATVAATRSRKAKVAAIAELLGRVDRDDREQVETVTSYLAGSLRQRRTGLGWRSMQKLPPAAEEPTLTRGRGARGVRADVRAVRFGLAGGARRGGRGSVRPRDAPRSRPGCAGIVTGEVRQGALDSLVQEGLAVAADVPLAAVRRAAMMAGSTVAVAAAALTGGEAALADYGLEVGRPVLPMLASSATTLEEAMAKAGGGEVAVDTKLDGVRIQVHRDGESVTVATRSLEDITDRLPEVVAAALALPAARVVLDGEVLALDDEGRPRPFQETASRAAMTDGVHLTPYFFDLLHLDGADLVDAPGRERLAALERLVPEHHLVPRVVTSDPAVAQAFLDDVLRPRARGRGGEEPGGGVRRGPARRLVGQGEAGAHPRPGGARGRVGFGAAARLALQHPPRRAGPRDAAAS